MKAFLLAGALACGTLMFASEAKAQFGVPFIPVQPVFVPVPVYVPQAYYNPPVFLPPTRTSFYRINSPFGGFGVQNVQTPYGSFQRSYNYSTPFGNGPALNYGYGNFYRPGGIFIP